MPEPSPSEIDLILPSARTKAILERYGQVLRSPRSFRSVFMLRRMLMAIRIGSFRFEVWKALDFGTVDLILPASSSKSPPADISTS